MSGDGLAGLAPFSFFCLFIVLAIVLSFVASSFRKKKLERFFRFAVENGLEFRAGLSDSSQGFFQMMYAGVLNTQTFLANYDGFQPIFRTNAKVYFIFDGKAGELPFQAFQYQYTTSNGKNTQTHYYVVASAELPIWAPELVVSTEDVLDKIGKVFGGQDIQFESEDFNKRFRVRGADEKRAHDVLHPQMMEWFMSVVPPGFQMKGRRVVLWKHGQLDTDFVMDTRAMLSQFWGLVPDYVKEEKH